MEKFVSYEKLSKKKQRELNAARRTTWEMSPVTRKPENPKAYKRKKISERELDSRSDFLHCLLQCEQIIGIFEKNIEK